MSMENAILEHAAALNNLAAAISAAAAFGTGVSMANTPAQTFGSDGVGAEIISSKAAELAATTEKRAAKARESAAKDAQQNAAGVKPDADLEQAVQKVEEQAKIEQVHSPDDDGLATLLDYAKDVRPVLLAAIKKAGKDKVQALINTFGVDKADKVDPAKHGELLAGAQKLAA